MIRALRAQVYTGFGLMKVSTLKALSPADGRPTRIGYRFTPDGQKVRVCKRTGADIDG